MMADVDSHREIGEDGAGVSTTETDCAKELCVPAADSPGRSTLIYSLTSPDLVIGSGSPDVPASDGFGESPEFFDNKSYSLKMEQSIELSLDNCIQGCNTKANSKSLAVRFSNVCQTISQVSSPESSFELPPPPMTDDDEVKDLISPSETSSGSKSAAEAAVAKSDGVAGYDSPEADGDCEFEGELQELVRNYKRQKKELLEVRRAVEELKRENEVKSRECLQARESLQELQNELMRKSMHVGSLAFAIEGQVKEKSRWFSSLRDLTRKLKIMKMGQIKLSEEASAYRKCLEDMNAVSSTIQSTFDQQVKIYEDLKVKFVQGSKQRKELYNRVLELKGNIRVFCRCRPLNDEEVAAGASMAIDFESSKDGELNIKSNGVFRRTFKFDAVFAPQADQAEVFEDTAPFATSVLDGYNVCIFAYGQTGTGKTYTMEGTDIDHGVNYRTLEELFRLIKEREQLFRYEIAVSVLEVYNEQIRDLLVSGNQAGAPTKRLEIRQVGEGMHHVPGLVEANVSNMNEVWEVLRTGSNARAVGSTNANEHSSRSHCIHCVMVKGENLLNGECTKSKLWLVDLAGSERIAKTEVQGERLKETQNINRSLSALGDVISALATKSPHVPFRNSKLTHLLQDSLGGDSKALMFVQISPHENDLSETLCSLNFASRVKGVELGPAKKQLDTAEYVKYKQMTEKMKLDMKSKDMQIKKMEETVHCLDAKIREKDLKNRCMQEKIKELESQLMVERKLARQHVDTKIAEQQQLKHQEEQNMQQMRPPLAGRQLANIKESPSLAFSKEQVNLNQPTDNYKPLLTLPSSDVHAKYNNSTEKENNPLMLDQLSIPKRTGRFSICPMSRQVPIALAPRRNSLIPLPSGPSSAPGPASLLPLQQRTPEKNEFEDECEASCLPEKIPCRSPKELKSGGKKISSALRRSLTKKLHMKSPMRKVGVNVGMEKVRVSIGSRGRIASRMLIGSNRVARTKEIQHKQSQKEKERRWNASTGRNVI